MANEVALPPVTARMWGREAASTRGPRPSLDLDSIVAAAIDIADRDGIAGVTMATVGARVKMAPMSLYRYVGSKDELLVMMVDAATPSPPEQTAQGWREYLATWTRSNRDFLLERPWILEAPRPGPPTGPNHLAWLEQVMTALDGTGIEGGEGIAIAGTLSGYAASQAALILGFGQPRNSGEESTQQIAGLQEYGQVLEALLDSSTHPALWNAIRQGAFSNSEWIEDADFTFGLDLLLDGIESLLARR